MDAGVTTQDTTPAHRLGTGPAYERMSIGDLAIALRLHHEGKTQTEIAQRLNKSQASISRALSKLASDSGPLAKAHLSARAYKAARRVTAIAEKSDNEAEALKAARVVLSAAGVIDTNGASVSVTAQVLIAQPHDPRTWGPGPQLIDSKALPADSARLTQDALSDSTQNP